MYCAKQNLKSPPVIQHPLLPKPAERERASNTPLRCAPYHRRQQIPHTITTTPPDQTHAPSPPPSLLLVPVPVWQRLIYILFLHFYRHTITVPPPLPTSACSVSTFCPTALPYSSPPLGLALTSHDPPPGLVIVGAVCDRRPQATRATVSLPHPSPCAFPLKLSPKARAGLAAAVIAHVSTR